MLAPSRIASEPVPYEKPPPWSHTITGRPRPAPRAGVHTFRTRQSSASAGALRRARATACGAVGPYARASRMSVQGTGLIGGMNRFFPAVDAPYGMPLKTLMPSVTVPRTRPADVVATTLSVSANADRDHGFAYIPARRSADCLTNVLRFEDIGILQITKSPNHQFTNHQITKSPDD